MHVPRIRAGALSGSVAHPERMPPWDAAALIRAYARSPGFLATNAAMRAEVFTRLAQIDVPVTLVWPDQDQLVSRPRQVPPAVRQQMLHGAGHVPMWDDPDGVAAVLLDASAPDARDAGVADRRGAG